MQIQMDRRVTRAGRKLRRHLNALGLSIPEWCARHRIESQRATIQRLVSGVRYRAIPADTILLVQRLADRDGLTLFTDDFASKTAKKVA